MKINVKLKDNKNILIRNAESADAPILAKWWNDGAVMAHAGFPNGLGITEKEIADDLATDTDESRRHVIEFCENSEHAKPIGEMNYRNKGCKIAQIGIKICETDYRERGMGTAILTAFTDALFNEMGYGMIILDTNVANTRAQHVYEKLGFKEIGRRDDFIDYELTAADWTNRK
ncbi:MAG: GNAT family N-acetyltransferase [Defluviitaleaceae bacterium]|nr:GNAT family N-acetyltransferase [Defluviitaleaceae bacterium]